MDEFLEEINKIKYHLRLLADTLYDENYPIESLVIELDWSREDLDAAHNIFEEYDKKVEKEEKINWTEFEFRIRDKFGIGYQTVKLIILAFYKNHQWTNVCKGYAKEHDVIEFKEINSISDNELIKSKLPPISGNELISLLQKDGWQLHRETNYGSALNKQFGSDKKVTIVPRTDKSLLIETLHAILSRTQTNLGRDGLLKLLNQFSFSSK
ncbi:MAG: DUF1878 family protein [Bacteroidetes bacterium]|nr:DUF1878 family protein [Bacteroidota bacterium]